MDLLKAIKERRSVRKFERRPVSPEVLRRLVETACWAPTGGNRQTWRFVIVTDERRLAKLRMVSPGLIGEPPAAIVVCEDLGGSLELLGESDASVSTTMDAPMAAYVMTLAALRRATGLMHRGIVQQGRGAAPPAFARRGRPGADRDRGLSGEDAQPSAAQDRRRMLLGDLRWMTRRVND